MIINDKPDMKISFIAKYTNDGLNTYAIDFNGA